MPYAMLLTKNEEDAKDLLHDAFIKLHSCAYEESGRKAGMIKTVILNRFIDLYRQRRKFGRFISPDLIIDQFRQKDFESEDMTHRQKAIIARYLYNLTPRDKKIWELYLDGFSQKQIAELMNWNINGVAAVCHRIREKLSKTIKG